MKRTLVWTMLIVSAMLGLLAACGEPDVGPPLGPFAAITKTETDAPFNLTPPSSRSPADFSYTSSNPAVATIAGSLVTIHGAGTSTITASQAAIGGWGPTSATTTLTVTAVACEGNAVRINGVCTTVPTCVSPATLQNNQCIPPASSAMLVHSGGLAWTGASFPLNWTDASAYCGSITVDGTAGWRLPTAVQLQGLQAANAISGKGWTVGATWSADMGTTSNIASHVTVDLASGASAERGDGAGAYVSCVR